MYRLLFLGGKINRSPFVLAIFVLLLFSDTVSAKIIFQDNFNGYKSRWEPPFDHSAVYPCPTPPCQGMTTWEPSSLPIEQRNNSNSWNGWIRNSPNDNLSIEMDTGVRSSPSLQITYSYPKDTNLELGLHKWLNDGPHNGGYDELYISYWFRFSDGFRFGTTGQFGYWKWMRIWAGVDLLDAQDYNGFITAGNEDFFGHNVILSSSTDSVYKQQPSWFVGSWEGTGSSQQRYIEIPGTLARVSDVKFTLKTSTDYSYLGGKNVKFTVDGVLKSAILSGCTYSGGINTCSVTSAVLTKTPTTFSIQPELYQFCGPSNSTGGWNPYNYAGALHAGQFPYHLGPISLEGYFENQQKWHHVQIHVKLRNGALSEDCRTCFKPDCSEYCGGVNNGGGVVEVWMDNEYLKPMRFNGTSYAFPDLPITTNVDGGINYIRFNDNMSGVTSGWSSQQYLWIDNITISTEFVDWDFF